MSAKHRARLKYIAGGDRKTSLKRARPKPYRRFEVEEWYKNYPDRPYAAVATRKLRFYRVNELVGDRPPSMVGNDDAFRVYLFLTGQDRDLFVETFHLEYRARAITIRTGNASQAKG